MRQTRFVPGRVAFTLNTAFQIVGQTLFVPKTASETLSAPPFMERVAGRGPCVLAGAAHAAPLLPAGNLGSTASRSHGECSEATAQQAAEALGAEEAAVQALRAHIIL